jgi:dTDP-4-dehydrorhamnose 3,5-epimerase
MHFSETPLSGVWLVEPERLGDERGFFARTFDGDALRARGLAGNILQCSISYNQTRGTLRGLHWQVAPYAEEKLVRCTMGRVFDVAVDLRRDSPTYKRWFSVELDAENRRQLYLPAGVAHGFQTLTDGCELFYQMSVPYHAELSRGARWNDPVFGIDWPLPPTVMSERDRSHPDFDEGGAS